VKTLLAILYVVLAASESTGVEVPVELPTDTPQGELARLQLEEVALSFRYREANPIMVQTRQKIAALLAMPEIRNDIYYMVLINSLMDLRTERAKLAARFRAENPRVVVVDRQIAFAQKALEERTNAPPSGS
jgi:hypothetical protein